MSPQRQPTREAGVCPVCGEPAASKFGVYCVNHKESGSRPPLEEWFTPQDLDMTAPAPAPEEGPVLEEVPGPEPSGEAERAPTSPYRSTAGAAPSMGNGAGGRLRRLLGLKPKAEKAETNGRAERAPRRTPRDRPRGGRRISTADDASEIYGQIAGRLELTRHYPVGRMMAWQAPMFGVVFDNAIAGSMLDRIAAQPLMRQKAKYEPLADLVVPPALIVGMTNALQAGNMTAFNAMAPILEYALDRHLLSIAPAAGEASRQAEAKNEAIADAFPDLAGQEIDGRPLSPAQVLMANLFREPEWAQAQRAQGQRNTEEAGSDGATIPTDPAASSQSPMG